MQLFQFLENLTSTIRCYRKDIVGVKKEEKRRLMGSVVNRDIVAPDL